MDAVIMTGGKGVRMDPFTRVTPKGLLPVGDMPILEIIVRQLRRHGFQSITMACGYMANYISRYFRDGTDFDVHIQYHVESQPLGTIGALAALARPRDAFLVMNCDVLTALDLNAFATFHCAGDSLLTIASQQKDTAIEFGVLETESDRVVCFHEKPKRSACVNMGMYVMQPEVLSYIPVETAFDIPDLVRVLLNAGMTVRHFQNDAYWLDIGSHHDYQLAQEQFSRQREQFLPGDRTC